MLGRRGGLLDSLLGLTGGLDSGSAGPVLLLPGAADPSVTWPSTHDLCYYSHLTHTGGRTLTHIYTTTAYIRTPVPSGVGHHPRPTHATQVREKRRVRACVHKCIVVVYVAPYFNSDVGVGPCRVACQGTGEISVTHPPSCLPTLQPCYMLCCVQWCWVFYFSHCKCCTVSKLPVIPEYLHFPTAAKMIDCAYRISTFGSDISNSLQC